MYCPYQDDLGYKDKNTPSPQALVLGTPSGKGVYLTEYTSSRPNMDTVYSQLYWERTGKYSPSTTGSILYSTLPVDLNQYCDLWYYEDLEEKADLLIDSIN